MSVEEFDVDHCDENELIKNVINSVRELINNKTSCDESSRNDADIACSDIDEYFDQFLKHQIKRNTENDMSCGKANSNTSRPNEELKLGNEKNSPTHHE